MQLGPINSGDAELDQLVRDWLEWNVEGSEDKLSVAGLVEKKEFASLKKLMRSRKTFGTAGIRGKMGPGFGQMNDLIIIQTSQGLAKYVLQDAGSSMDAARRSGVVIGYDARFNSQRWARLTAGVFLREGFKVLLFSRITPTPWVPFTVRRMGAAVGVMVTASHNPKEDNGYKVYWNNGAQIQPPHDSNIQRCILANLVPSAGDDNFSESFLDSYDDASTPALVDPLAEMNEAYFRRMEEGLFNKAMNEHFDKSIVYTAMHGVGADYVDQAFQRAGFKPLVHVKEQREPDPTFPTVKFPNPEEGKSALDLAMKTAAEHDSIYILANDPDADRLAVAEKLEDGAWKVFSGNEIGALLGWWQFQVHMTHYPDANKANLYFIASTVSSKMLRSIAREEGFTFEETLTGFKWMANRADEIEKKNASLPADQAKKVLLAFEESIGFMCGTNVLDKDGVSACVRSAELIAFLQKRNMTLAEKLNNLYEVYGYHCSEISYFMIEDHEDAAKLFSSLRNFGGRANTYPDRLAQYAISSVRDLTTGFDSSQPDLRATLPVSDCSEMITFQLENGTVLTLRTSGTEPKLKYYAEYCAKPDQKDWPKIEEELKQIVGLFIKEFVQPEKYGLKYRSD